MGKTPAGLGFPSMYAVICLLWSHYYAIASLLCVIKCIDNVSQKELSTPMGAVKLVHGE